MLLFPYQGKEWHCSHLQCPLTEVWKASVDKRMVSKGMWLSQYAPKGVKSLCITSSQTLHVRKPDLVSCKTHEHLLSKSKIRGSAYMWDRLIWYIRYFISFHMKRDCNKHSYNTFTEPWSWKVPWLKNDRVTVSATEAMFMPPFVCLSIIRRNKK